MSEEIIGPPQLQVLCHQLEEQMREKGKNSISVADLGGDEGMRKLLSRYYRGILEKFSAVRLGPGPRRVSGILGSLRRLQPVHSPRFAVRRLCEERLITAGGNRNSRHEDEIIREIGVAPADLQELVESRLLRREPRLQESFYELSHDSLVPALQVAGGMRQTWVMGLKIAMLALMIFVVINWGVPFVQGFYELRTLASELVAVKNGQVQVDYFHDRLAEVRRLVGESKKLDGIETEFDNWRIDNLRSAFLKAELSQADTLLQVFKNEYPREEVLFMALSDTLRERQIRQIQQRYQRLFDKPVDLQEAYVKAGQLLDSAFTAFQGNIRITELQKDLAKRRGDIGEQEKLARIIASQQDIADKALRGAIQIAEPKNMIVKGDSSGKASSFELVLEYNSLLTNATVLLNGKEMSGEEILGNEKNKLPFSPRQKGVPTRTGKFLSGIVPIPAGAREVQVKITARNSDGVEASRDFTFTVDREPPRVRTKKIFYRDDEKEAWKEMPNDEWRGNFWRIEVEPSEPLQGASVNIRPRFSNPDLSQISSVGADDVSGSLAKDGREAAFLQATSEKYKIAEEVECTLRLQDLAGWQSMINLGKWEVAKAQAEIKPTIQLPIKLRSMPDENLTEDEVRSMIKKYDLFCNDKYEYSWSNPKGKGIIHNFVSQQNGQVVLDRATGLMWQQSGSTDNVPFEWVKSYIENLNRQKFAGFRDWRLPTLEEAMSLMMDSAQSGNLYISPIFNPKQFWIWTADKLSAGSEWAVFFDDGYCDCYNFVGGNFVRAVRNAQ
ncbi:MAG: hypothetical protein ILNGONEN_02063 [Syntrophorhabdaceae bacterium]|nr:hypothetical protein [Syntrophorhabdaceae bacterium]